jgi:hypothetical protein
MTEGLSIGELLDAAAAQMWIDFEKIAQLDHPAEKGRGREDALRDFLREYLPERFGVDTGFLVDVHGNVSGQMDIVIFDRASAPVFKMSSTVRVFPVESVAAVIQVKSKLDGRELKKAVENLRTALALDRVGSQHPYEMLGGVMHASDIHVTGGDPDFLAESEPILTAIFAFQGTNIGQLASEIRRLDADVAIDRRLPFICVLDQGVISYAIGDNDQGGVLAPYNAYYAQAWLGCVPSQNRGLNLRMFYVMLGWGASRKIPLTPSYRRYAGLPSVFVDPVN